MTNSQFVKGKGQILTEYQRMRKKLGSAVAGRGFSYEPGFMFDAQNDLEIDIKQQISELNYKILEETINRELKQSKQDYSLAFKNAVIAWEAEKQALIAAFDQEMVIMKREMATDEEVVKLLAIEVSKRAIDLMEAKTAIELQAEAIRKQIAELDGTTGSYEIELAEAKLLTAQKKLEVIPYIEQLLVIEEQLVDKEYQLLDKESSIVAKIQQIVSKELTLVGKESELQAKFNAVLAAEKLVIAATTRLLAAKTTESNAETEFLAAEEDYINTRISELTPLLTALVAEMDEYVVELVTQLDLYDQIADVKTETVAIKELQADKQDQIITAKRLIANAVFQLAEMVSGLTDYQIAKLAPAISNLVTIYEQYADEIETQTELKTDIANIKALSAALVSQQVAGKLSVSNAETSLENQTAAYRAAQLATDLQRGLNKVAQAEQETTNTMAYGLLWTAAENQSLITQEAAVNSVSNLRKLRAILDFSERADDTIRVDDAQILAIKRESNDFENYMRQDADIRTATSGVTARLTHLLSQD